MSRIKLIARLGACILWPAYANALADPGAPVDPTALSSVIDSADRIVVYKTEMKDAPMLYESKAPEDIAEFDKALTISLPRDGEKTFCTCIAEPDIRLYRQGLQVGEIRMFSGTSIGVPSWDSDASIADPDRWMKWFDRRNISGPRNQFEEEQQQAIAARAAYVRWTTAMPESIRPLWPYHSDMETTQPSMMQVFAHALETHTPDRQQRARILFSWFGSGLGPWSGFPAYEETAENLLLQLPTDDLVMAAESRDLTEAELEGAARLFGGWTFSHQRPHDRGRLPTELKRRLLEHVRKTAAGPRDTDRQNRATAAFGAS